MPPSDGVSVRTLWCHSDWTSPPARELSVTAPLCLSCQSPLQTMMMMMMMMMMMPWAGRDDTDFILMRLSMMLAGDVVCTQVAEQKNLPCKEPVVLRVGWGGGDCPGWPEGEVSLSLDSHSWCFCVHWPHCVCMLSFGADALGLIRPCQMVEPWAASSNSQVSWLIPQHLKETFRLSYIYCSMSSACCESVICQPSVCYKTASLVHMK